MAQLRFSVTKKNKIEKHKFASGITLMSLGRTVDDINMYLLLHNCTLPRG